MMILYSFLIKPFPSPQLAVLQTFNYYISNIAKSRNLYLNHAFIIITIWFKDMVSENSELSLTEPFFFQQLLTGSDNLDQVRSLELKVDTTETSLNNFGSLLPNLTVLKLSGSIIPCIRFVPKQQIEKTLNSYIASVVLMKYNRFRLNKLYTV